MLSTPPNPAAWVWGYRSAVRLLKVTAGGFGPLRTRVPAQPFNSLFKYLRKDGPFGLWSLDIFKTPSGSISRFFLRKLRDLGSWPARHFDGRWFLSRKDSTIVARHEVPGIMRKITPSQRDD